MKIRNMCKPFDYLTGILVAVSLLAGYLLLSSGSRLLVWNGAEIRYPASFRGNIRKGRREIRLRNVFSRSPNFTDRLHLRMITVSTNSGDPVHAYRRSLYSRRRLYREIDGGGKASQGRNWLQFEYAYVVDPDTGSPGQDARPPVVVQGITRIFQKKGGASLYVFSYDCDSLDYRSARKRAITVFNSLILK